ncbi:MAG: energy transducer TonB [Bacteroides sp.]|nr:energy transducer TonB [Bacteroides sp.]
MSSQSDNRKSHMWALLATILFHAVVLVVLLSVFLRYSPSSPSEREWPPVDSAEVLFAGEYVMIGDDPTAADNDSSDPAAEADATTTETETADNIDAGTHAEPSPLISTETPSTAKTKTKPQPEVSGPTKAEIEAAEKARREEEKRREIADRMKNTHFGSTAGSGSGNPGQADGNSTSGATSGMPGYNLKGRSIAVYEQPPRGPLGSVTIRVTVNRKGIVTSARYESGTGSAAASASTRKNCEQAAMKSQFSVDEDAPSSQSGTITYNFR